MNYYCKTCGTEILSKSRRFCDEICQKAYDWGLSRADYLAYPEAVQGELDSEESAYLEPDGRCCDCGRPSWDHRCPECLAKWQKAHGVIVRGGGSLDE